MGIFDLFKKKNEPFEFVVDLKKHVVDNFYIISLPVEWEPFESDRFRAKTQDEKLQMSIVNYVNKSEEKKSINEQLFKDLKLELYDEFVTEGEYEPYDDLKVTNSFITKSFKVDEETQYYYTTARLIDEQLIITDIIVREIGDYNKKMQPILEIIGRSIKKI